MPSQVAVSITTQSQVMSSYQQSGTPPTITFDGNPLPQPDGGKLYYPSGFQVVVLNAVGNLTDPSAIRSNQWQPVPNSSGNWMDVYQYMYSGIVTQLLTSGNPNEQIVLAVSFGLDANMPPTPDALAAFLQLGAGPQLQTWETTVDTGSQGGGWVGSPANYVLVGASRVGYGQGTEKFEYPGTDSVTTKVEATLTNYGG